MSCFVLLISDFELYGRDCACVQYLLNDLLSLRHFGYPKFMTNLLMYDIGIRTLNVHVCSPVIKYKLNVKCNTQKQHITSKYYYLHSAIKHHSVRSDTFGSFLYEIYQNYVIRDIST